MSVCPEDLRPQHSTVSSLRSPHGRTCGPRRATGVGAREHQSRTADLRNHQPASCDRVLALWLVFNWINGFQQAVQAGGRVVVGKLPVGAGVQHREPPGPLDGLVSPRHVGSAVDALALRAVLSTTETVAVDEAGSLIDLRGAATQRPFASSAGCHAQPGGATPKASRTRYWSTTGIPPKRPCR